MLDENNGLEEGEALPQESNEPSPVLCARCGILYAEDGDLCNPCARELAV